MLNNISLTIKIFLIPFVMQTICCEVVTHEYTQTHKDVCIHKYQDYHQIEFLWRDTYGTIYL